jgi:plasmid maintenance system antidote protein VapI
MTMLDRWMTENGWDDSKLAEAIARDRSQVSRIRRGVCGTTKEVALRIEKITGIAWHEFIEPRSEEAAQ